jgi:acyl-CoA synthetase (AMP-forming)/AMP-acid ligase II/acyl-CoA reductase-like NAD-dependent aldehyde dehydrogenase
MTYPEGEAALRYFSRFQQAHPNEMEIVNLLEPHKLRQNSVTAAPVVRRVGYGVGRLATPPIPTTSPNRPPDICEWFDAQAPPLQPTVMNQTNEMNGRRIMDSRPLNGANHKPDATQKPTSRIVTLSSSHSGTDVARLALRTAANLRGRGITSGDRVLLKADNSVDMIVTFLALLHLDTSVILLDTQLTTADCARSARITGASWLLSRRDEAVDAGVTTVRLADATQVPPGSVPLDQRLTLDRWLRRRDALITWSSGSTGEPKAMVRCGQALFDNLSATADRMRYRDDDVLLPLLPFTHFYGLTLLMLWWQLGCTLALTPAGRLDQALRLAGRAGVTVVDGTPSTYHSILRIIERHPSSRPGLDRVRMWCVGGAPLSETLADDFHATFGLPLLDGYGSSEAGNIALAAPGDIAPGRSGGVGCGRPLDGVAVQVVGPDANPVAMTEIGRILVRTPALMEGYLGADGTTLFPDSEYYATGDRGYVDRDGNLFVVGRENAVHRFGHTLYPSAIERRAAACGAPVKVLAFDDARRGCQLVFVVADPDRGDARRWQSAINALLPGYEQPNQVLVMEEFPLTSTGKPDLAGLRQFAQASLTEDTPPAAAPRVPGQAVPFPERIDALCRVVEFLRGQPDQVVDLLTGIATHRSVRLELEAAISTLEGAVEEVTRHRPASVHKMAVFMPSNVLLYSYVLYLLVPSLYVQGVTFRPSSKVAAQTWRFHEVLAPIHGLPLDISSLSQRKFVEGPGASAGLLVFTGTYANAERIRATLSKEQVFVFFGQGVNPFVVGMAADLGQAVDDAIRIRLHNSGQDCFGPDVLLVPGKRQTDFVGGLCKRLSELRFGKNSDPDADYGPLYYEDAMSDAVEYLQRHRKAIVHGGNVDFGSSHVEPTVFLRESSEDPALQEFFAPLFNIVTYADQEALHDLLTCPYLVERAMGAMVYGLDDGTIALLAKRHAVAVDRTLLELDDGNRPFGGRGMMANYVSFNGARTAEPLLLSKVVSDYFGGDVCGS